MWMGRTDRQKGITTPQRSVWAWKLHCLTQTGCWLRNRAAKALPSSPEHQIQEGASRALGGPGLCHGPGGLRPTTLPGTLGIWSCVQGSDLENTWLGTQVEG